MSHSTLHQTIGRHRRFRAVVRREHGQRSISRWRFQSARSVQHGILSNTRAGREGKRHGALSAAGTVRWEGMSSMCSQSRAAPGWRARRARPAICTEVSMDIHRLSCVACLSTVSTGLPIVLLLNLCSLVARQSFYPLSSTSSLPPLIGPLHSPSAHSPPRPQQEGSSLCATIHRPHSGPSHEPLTCAPETLRKPRDTASASAGHG
ncbi:hypothetical protein BU26DRAFT_149195 [Trematosphaeria pertusa]|uniref:Uncharacterized protein n=1 Tax=Trematosphaeria pertusa TaxID=390896 RepID=A0A6A6IWZ6_9PLEO|nr:uncharacterized protein BU26DRAFT_149195 [Trematosphaeria pertusa]KAF2254989.1 hypothetical protein BU26DRAFT_149195 [Trematosphaeria pertusa]